MNQASENFLWSTFQAEYTEAINHRHFVRASNIIKEALYSARDANSLDSELIADADSLAEISSKQGQHNNAAVLYRLIYELRSNVYGTNHPDVKVTQLKLESALSQSGHFAPLDVTKHHRNRR